MVSAKNVVLDAWCRAPAGQVLGASEPLRTGTSGRLRAATRNEAIDCFPGLSRDRKVRLVQFGWENSEPEQVPAAGDRL